VTSNQKVLIYITNIKKVIAKLYSFAQNNWQTKIGQKFHLIPMLPLSLNRTPPVISYKRSWETLLHCITIWTFTKKRWSHLSSL